MQMMYIYIADYFFQDFFKLTWLRYFLTNQRTVNYRPNSQKNKKWRKMWMWTIA